jgi:hypothetical protein
VNMVLEEKKETLKRHKLKNRPFLTWKWVKQIPVWNCPIYDDIWNVELSILPKLALMNNHHCNL